MSTKSFKQYLIDENIFTESDLNDPKAVKILDQDECSGDVMITKEECLKYANIALHTDGIPNPDDIYEKANEILDKMEQDENQIFIYVDVGRDTSVREVIIKKTIQYPLSNVEGVE